MDSRLWILVSGAQGLNWDFLTRILLIGLSLWVRLQPQVFLIVRTRTLYTQTGAEYSVNYCIMYICKGTPNRVSTIVSRCMPEDDMIEPNKMHCGMRRLRQSSSLAKVKIGENHTLIAKASKSLSTSLHPMHPSHLRERVGHNHLRQLLLRELRKRMERNPIGHSCIHHECQHV